MRHPLNTKVLTPSAQGGESYITVQRLTWGERREVQRRMNELSDAHDEAKEKDKGSTLEAYNEALYKFIFEHLVSWSWVGDDGKQMPLPKSTADITDYRDEEIKELLEIGSSLIRGNLTFTEVDKGN